MNKAGSCKWLLFSLALSALPVGGAETDAVNTLQIPAADEIEPTVVAFREYHDPWEGFNRRVFGFNDIAYRHALIPLSNGYVKVVPAPARRGLGRLFDNLREPLHAINHGLQGEFPDAGHNLLRFLTNSTLGIVGIFDPALHWFEIEARTTSLNDTLRGWDLDAGPYLVLPLLGPGDLRGGTAATVETLVHPLRFLAPETEAAIAIAGDRFQAFAPSAGSYLTLRDEADDPYLYFRNQYLQGRARDEAAIDATR